MVHSRVLPQHIKMGTYSEPQRYKFSTDSVWIQVHGLELKVLNSGNARQIGKGIEKCIEIEQSMDHQIKRGFLRIKVKFVASQPLVARFW